MPSNTKTYRCDRKGSDITITFHLAYMLAVQAAIDFAGHREFVAWLFKKEGFAITNFIDLKNETWQDGDKRSLDITHKVTGTVGKNIVKL